MPLLQEISQLKEALDDQMTTYKVAIETKIDALRINLNKLIDSKDNIEHHLKDLKKYGFKSLETELKNLNAFLENKEKEFRKLEKKKALAKEGLEALEPIQAALINFKQRLDSGKDLANQFATQHDQFKMQIQTLEERIKAEDSNAEYAKLPEKLQQICTLQEKMGKLLEQANSMIDQAPLTLLAADNSTNKAISGMTLMLYDGFKKTQERAQTFQTTTEQKRLSLSPKKE